MSDPDQGALCLMCGNGRLEALEAFGRLTRVTSDCRPWPAGGRLAVCLACGAVQKCPDPVWRDECRSIYRDYAVYALAGGAEQRVFDQTGSAAASRSDAILEHLSGTVSLPAVGRLLDIGCGNGAFLSAFSRRYPGWSLHGAELDARHRATLERIPGFHSLHLGDIATIGQRFDTVVLIHALEHMDDPVGFLGCIRRDLLMPDGLLVIEVPDYSTNPFDLLIADHLLHFSASVLGAALGAAGLAPVALTNQWIPKELTVIARAGSEPPPPPPPEPARAQKQVNDHLLWLADFARYTMDLAASTPIGVFGTAIAGSWLAGVLGERAAFFVDEDPARAGRCYLGRPVFGTAQVPDPATVMVALAPALAARVAARLTTGGRRYHAAPADFRDRSS